MDDSPGKRSSGLQCRFHDDYILVGKSEVLYDCILLVVKCTELLHVNVFSAYFCSRMHITLGVNSPTFLFYLRFRKFLPEVHRRFGMEPEY